MIHGITDNGRTHVQNAHNDLVNYQPVYHWETRPPTNFSCGLLRRAGIDPETVPSEGLARQIMLAIGRRRYKGLCEIRDLSSAAEHQVEGLWKLTKKDLQFMARRER
jgi:hypothetical protein